MTVRGQAGQPAVVDRERRTDPPDESLDLSRDPELVYRRLAPEVLGYLRGQGAPDPEGTLGEVFLHVARDLHKVEGNEEAVRRWVFSVARHRLIDERRRRAVRPRLVKWRKGLDPPSHDPPSPQLDAELVDALQQLTRRQREVVVLRFVADLPLASVAEITGKRVGAVKSLQQRGLDRLRHLLNDDPSG